MPRAKKINPRPNGRTKKPIDWELVDLLLEAQCEGTEIAYRFHMHPNTFYERLQKEKGTSFTEYAQCKYCHGKSNGRLRQYKSMMQGNTAAMLHWACHNLDQPSKSHVKQDIVHEVTQRKVLSLPRSGERFQEEEKNSTEQS